MKVLGEDVGEPIDVRRAVAPIIGFLIMAAYWPMHGAPVVPRWLVGSLMLPALPFMARSRLTPSHWALLALVVFLLATLLWAPVLNVVAGLCLLAIVAAFVYGSALDNIMPFVIGAICGLSISSAVVIVQQFIMLPLPYFSKPAALFYNPNILAEAGAVVIVAAIALELWWGAIALTPTLFLTGARGPLIATTVAIQFLINNRNGQWKSRLLVGCVAFVTLIMIVRGNADSLNLRLQYWQDIAMALYGHCSRLLVGYGLGSFWSTFPNVAQHQYTAIERPNHAHNEMLELAYEGGVVALVLAAAFVVALAREIRAHKLAAVVVALGIMAIIAFPLRTPATALFGVVIAGHLTRRQLV